jgi:hypothetical protein
MHGWLLELLEFEGSNDHVSLKMWIYIDKELLNNHHHQGKIWVSIAVCGNPETCNNLAMLLSQKFKKAWFHWVPPIMKEEVSVLTRTDSFGCKFVLISYFVKQHLFIYWIVIFNHSITTQHNSLSTTNSLDRRKKWESRLVPSDF